MNRLYAHLTLGKRSSHTCEVGYTCSQYHLKPGVLFIGLKGRIFDTCSCIKQTKKSLAGSTLSNDSCQPGKKGQDVVSFDTHEANRHVIGREECIYIYLLMWDGTIQNRPANQRLGKYIFKSFSIYRLIR